MISAVKEDSLFGCHHNLLRRSKPRDSRRSAVQRTIFLNLIVVEALNLGEVLTLICRLEIGCRARAACCGSESFSKVESKGLVAYLGYQATKIVCQTPFKSGCLSARWGVGLDVASGYLAASAA